MGEAMTKHEKRSTGGRARGVRLAIAMLVATALCAGAAASASATLTNIYNNIPTPVPGNVPSEGFECCSASEFGGQVEFASGTWKNPKVTILMSSWACQEGSWFGENCLTVKGAKFEVPITVSLYEVGPGDAPGAKIAAASKVFKIPYRPSVSTICKQTQNAKGGWYDKKEEHCYNGYAAKIAIQLKVAKLPAKAIVSVAYNTTHYGYQPRGESEPCYTGPGGCPYDSLNVGAKSALAEEAYPLPDFAYINSTSAEEYCGSSTTLGTFGISGSNGNPCWNGFQPSFRVDAVAS
jgi:hypothetical protein